MTELLLACLRSGAPGPSVRSARPHDVRRMLGVGALHGVLPLVYARAQATGLALDSRAERQLRDAYLHSKLRALAARAEIAEVLRAISGAGVPVIALKGACFAEHLWRDPALRPMLDLDLLVPAERAAEAAAAVRDLGYEWERSVPESDPRHVDYDAHQHLRRLMRPGRLPVELHRALTARDVPWWIEPTELWRRAVPATIAGVDVMVLASEHQLLHLVMHAATHSFAVPLLALADVARLAEQLTSNGAWPRFVQAANDTGAGGIAYATLELVRTLLGADVPVAAVSGLQHSASDEAIVPALARTVLDQFTAIPVAFERSLAEPGVRAKSALLLKGLLPSPARLREKHGLAAWSPAIAWYYLRRPFDLMRRHGPRIALLLTPSRFRDGRLAVAAWLGAAAHR